MIGGKVEKRTAQLLVTRANGRNARRKKQSLAHTDKFIDGYECGVGVLSHDDDRVTRGLYLQIDTISIEL